ncbi:hypothetical protein SERLA73DRAFT_119694 [Serpula lacrymans var. lacrymans S7.3]|uniref:Uncharacterized protein n=2 Tax=Serpula lacrymans var. lacrymans TaxID=341189 RepID=F8PJJ8_SERL3|nr:uncharacterized protein SERLADRAFT_379791 [Serpula lacrymans var. lacrymans S7.9]EGO04136.1 hypothetical protein SERLA73DRAFT_119694 [Serpula lacrymans var. lacrymans S7.3]EGO30068.1 hypothetical protein SERLADRAFT_379791 [Serpula lacrymans var. lacrymans S7.9]
MNVEWLGYGPVASSLLDDSNTTSMWAYAVLRLNGQRGLSHSYAEENHHVFWIWS